MTSPDSRIWPLIEHVKAILEHPERDSGSADVHRDVAELLAAMSAGTDRPDQADGAYLAVLLDTTGFHDESRAVLRSALAGVSERHRLDVLLEQDRVLDLVRSAALQTGRFPEDEQGDLRDLDPGVGNRSSLVDLARASTLVATARRRADRDLLREAASRLAQATARRIGELDPDDPNCLLHLGDLAVAQLASARADSSAERVEAVTDVLRIVAFRLLASVGLTDHPGVLAIAAESAFAQVELALEDGVSDRLTEAAGQLRALLRRAGEAVPPWSRQALALAANVAVVDVELARSTGSQSELKAAVDRLRDQAALNAQILGPDNGQSLAMSVNLAVVELELAQAAGSGKQLREALKSSLVTYRYLEEKLGTDHPYSVTVAACLRRGRGPWTKAIAPGGSAGAPVGLVPAAAAWGPGCDYASPERAVELAKTRQRAIARRPEVARPQMVEAASPPTMMVRDPADRVARLLTRRPDIIRVETPGEAYFKRDELLVLARDVDAVQEATRRWVDSREDFAELGVARLRLRSGSGVDVAALVTDLRGGASAQRRTSVTPNHVVRVEPYFSGSSSAPSPTRDLPAPVSVGGPGRRVVVGVLDTGIDPHPWFAATNWFRESGPDDREVVEDRQDWDLDSEAGHGTFVAGVIMQRAPSVFLRMERILGADGVADELDVLRGLARLRHRAAAASDRLDIVNLSLGCFTFDDRPSPVLADAIAQLSRSTVVVAAAGNSDTDRPFWPAALKDTIAVAALAERSSSDGPERASFSNYGWWVDAAAPGENVASSFLTYQDGGSGADFHGYAAWSGTSFAAPFVAGSIAALMSAKDMLARDAATELLDPSYGNLSPDLGVVYQG